jgi:thiamine biosynthesis lipoprotein
MTAHLRSALLAFAFAVPQPSAALAATAHAGQIVMGTVLQVTVVAHDTGRAQQLALRAIDIARHWDDVLTIWRPDGELAALNARAGKGAQRISPDLFVALSTMTRLSRATDGAFDPGVAPLVARFSKLDQTGPMPPAATRIREALKLRPGAAELSEGAALDAGGIGKGIALDTMAATLRSGGATGAYLDFGGSSQLAFGARDDGTPWTLGLGGLAAGVTHGVLELDGALSTSRSRPIGDVDGPIIDPVARRVVEASRFVTCYTSSGAAEAEACSKAFIVLGWAAYDPQRRPGWEALYEDDEGLRSSPLFPATLLRGPQTKEYK